MFRYLHRPKLPVSPLATPGIVVAVAAAWSVLFALNGWLFSGFEITRYINWVFLPAGLRLLAVLELGWRGVAGLFLGGLVTSLSLGTVSPGSALALAGMSSLGCLAGVRVAERISEGQVRWQSMDALQVYVFATACAASNALLHCVYFASQGIIGEFLDNLIPMFIGDLAGSFLVIYCLAKPLCRRLQRPDLLPAG